VNTYSIKIALRGISPMIWRRLRVDGNTTIADLHNIVQIAMGWDDEYLHEFHIHGEDYGISRIGGRSFRHRANQVSVDDFGFDVGDRFTYTYNFYSFWVCDVRIEAIEPMSKPVPRCYRGSGRKGDNNYYKIDQFHAAMAVIEKITTSKKTALVGDLRELFDYYESTRFSRSVINKQLKESFPDMR
jgi:hypothetical protein